MVIATPLHRKRTKKTRGKAAWQRQKENFFPLQSPTDVTLQKGTVWTTYQLLKVVLRFNE